MHKKVFFQSRYYQPWFLYGFAGSEEDRLKLYKDIEQLFPRASAPRRLPLNFAEGKDCTNTKQFKEMLSLVTGTLYIYIN